MSLRNVTFTAHPKRMINDAVQKTLELVKEPVLNDCNRYVREDQGTLLASGRSEVEGLDIIVTHNTPYAKRTFYTGTPRQEINPNASLMWDRKAADNHGDEWRRAIEKGLKSTL